MVSPKLLSLPDKYINDAKKLIELLDIEDFGVLASFWYIRTGEDDEWTNGDWRLVITSDYAEKCGTFDGYNFIRLQLQKIEDTKLRLDDIELISVHQLESTMRYWDEILIK